jgi:hypothetical protein
MIRTKSDGYLAVYQIDTDIPSAKAETSGSPDLPSAKTPMGELIVAGTCRKLTASGRTV